MGSRSFPLDTYAFAQCLRRNHPRRRLHDRLLPDHHLHVDVAVGHLHRVVDLNMNLNVNMTNTPRKIKYWRTRTSLSRTRRPRTRKNLAVTIVEYPPLLWSRFVATTLASLKKLSA